MIVGAEVLIECDKCQCETEIDLVYYGSRQWRALGLDSKLEALGWSVNNDDHLCPTCTRKHEKQLWGTMEEFNE